LAVEEGVEEVKVDVDQLQHVEHIVPDRKLRAVPVLLLSCIVFGLASAAFAWTTLRVHDRQMSAEANEKAVAFLLGTPGLETSEQPVSGGGSVTAFYSPKLHRFAITGHDLPTLSGGHTYEFWYRTGAGATPKPAGNSRFDGPQNDVVVVSLPGGVTAVEVTVEASGDAHTHSSPPIAELTFG
jgi:hypothetical protein